jgi:5-keto 4-deoxyuronate isomerase
MKKLLFIFLWVYFPNSQAAWADMVNFTEVPTNWVIENSVGGTINAYNTPTSCPSGRLRLHTGITEGDKNRFWSTIMTAKATNRTVTIYYDPTLEDCQLVIFRLN